MKTMTLSELRAYSLSSYLKQLAKTSPKDLVNLCKDKSHDKNFIWAAVQACGAMYNYASEELKNDKTIVLLAVENDPDVFRFIPFEYRNDKDLALSCIKRKASLYHYAPKKLLEDKDVALCAVNQNYKIFERLPYQLRADKTLLLAAMKSSQRFVSNIERELQQELEQYTNGSYYEIIGYLEKSIQSKELKNKLEERLLNKNDVRKIKI